MGEGSTEETVEDNKSNESHVKGQPITLEGNAVADGTVMTAAAESSNAGLRSTASISSLREARRAAATSILNRTKSDELGRSGTPASVSMASIASAATDRGHHARGKEEKDDANSTTHAESLEPGRLSELKRFTLWETRTKFYLVAYNTSQTRFRILKVDRTPELDNHHESREKEIIMGDGHSTTANEEAAAIPESSVHDVTHTELEADQEALKWNLNVTSDRVVYTRSQISELLDMIGEGNKSTGGLKEVGRFFGIVGFIRFTSTYYLVLISRRSVVGLLGGHYIYHCDETKILPVCHASVLASLTGRTKAMDQKEARLLHTFKQVDLSKNFYFSYTYDLTKTLQDNLTMDDSNRTKETTAWGYNEKFMWNHHLLLPAFASSQHSWKNKDTGAASEWVLPLVYGFVDQAKLCVLNCIIHVTLIARRSRHFAGARFLKRGTDENGHVANDVETEQIVSEALTTPFYGPVSRKPGQEGIGVGPNPRYTSYVMHRGSIPIYWTQDSTNMSPRPPIEISVVDPYYSSAALHFDDMLRRYGHPIIVLNLIKSKEKQPREVKLLGAFGECVGYLNQFLPVDKKLKYIAWDMSRASKSRDQDVIGVLEDIAEETVNATKFFHTGSEPNSFAFTNVRKQRRETILLQSGVARVNCVDCLDRTNAAQFVIGKAAFGHQLHALGLLTDQSLPFDSAAVDMLTEMYHDLGDTIALQYGGSHLVNTMETYRKINQWTSHSRDMLEGLKRYYANSFVDADKQAAINLFLGVDRESATPPLIATRKRRHYQQWFTPEYLEPRDNILQSQQKLYEIINTRSTFWAEYYRPSLFTDLLRHHAFKMTAVHQHIDTAVIGPLPLSPSKSNLINGKMSSSPSSISGPFGGSASLSPTEASVNTISPFTSRVVTASEPSQSVRKTSGSRLPQKPIIGGVRRWMSLNRGDERSISSTSTRKSSNRIDSEMIATKEAIVSSVALSESAWPTWEEITGVQVTAPSTEVLLKSLTNPIVSLEEAKEYAWWLDQFREVAFDGGLPSSIPEPAALMPINALNAMSSGMAPLYQIGIHHPATQKQRQQIAEADAHMYEYQVGLSQGQESTLIKMKVEEGEIDAAIYNYPLSTNTLNSVVSERKVRAFSQWITGPNKASNVLFSLDKETSNHYPRFMHKNNNNQINVQ